MKVALISKNKLKFVDGTFAKPATASVLHDPWIRCNNMVLSWLQRSISEGIAQSTLWIDNAHLVWKNLESRFSQGDIFKISDIQDDLTKLQQGNLDISNYFTKLTSLWEQIDSYRPIRDCVCEIQCTCGAATDLRKYKEQDRVIKFLKGLNEQFSNVRSQIMLLDPLPTLDKTFSLVLGQERQLSNQFSSEVTLENQTMAMQVPNSNSNGGGRGNNYFNSRGRGRTNSGFGRGNSTQYCTNCGRNNHTLETCFIKHGYPPGFQSKNHKSNTNNVVATASDLPTGSFVGQDNTSPSLAVIQDQYSQILQLLQSSNFGVSSPATMTQVATNIVADHHCINSVSSPLMGKQAVYWVIDTGATHHITPNFVNFISYCKVKPIAMELPNGNIISTNISGSVQISEFITLHDVYYLPTFHVNLISVSKLMDSSNCHLNFTNAKCLILQNSTRRVIGTADRHGDLYVFQAQALTSAPTTSNTCNKVFSITDSATLWHHRLGHTSDSIQKCIASQFPFISYKSNDKIPCDTCHFSKQRRLPYPISTSHSSKIFDILHADIWGPYAIPSISGHKYFLTLVDDFSRFTWIILMAHKGETRKHLVNFISYIETQFSTKLKCLRSDNGPEFLMYNFFQSKGILHQRSCVECPQQNGIVERKHQHILNVARSLSFQAHLPKNFWHLSIQHAIHLINRLPTPLLHNKSPFTLLHNALPTFSHLKCFGCLAFASTLHVHRTKFQSRARKSVFLGYRNGTKGYLLYDLNSNEFFVSRNVVFFENVYPFSSVHSSQGTSSIPIVHGDNTDLEPLISTPNTTPATIEIDHITPPASPIANPVPPDHAQTLRKSNRTITRPSYLNDYHCDLLHKTKPATNIVYNIPFPLSSVLTYDNCKPSYQNFCMTVSSITEPKTYNQACKHDCWVTAMNTELKALESTQTWSIVDMPTGKKPIGCKWVYKVKYFADGSIERYKARLVAKGYTQLEGVDYFDTFSPVAKLTTVRTLIALASIKNWFLEQLDVNNAFLHADLHEEVYMSIPPGYKLSLGSSSSTKVCKLLKSIYGLKQASRQWYSKLSNSLISLGYSHSIADYSLFTKQNKDHFTALLVYVDDIVLTGNDYNEIQQVKSFLNAKFMIKDLGNLRYFLGLEVARSPSGIVLNQRKYVLELLHDTGLLATKPVSTPYDLSLKLHCTESDIFQDITQYRRLIGRLIYLTTTRPDIAFVVQQLSQHVSQLRVVHYRAAIRILQYLKSCPAKGLFYAHKTDLSLWFCRFGLGYLPYNKTVCDRIYCFSWIVFDLMEVKEAVYCFQIKY